MRAYVFRAVELNALKRRARRVREARLGREAVKAEGAAAGPEAPGEGIDPLALEDALAGLPEEQRIVLRMKYYLGLTFREIAATLRISANTAASRARYALNVLRRALRSARRSGPDP
jgi:RNA polymerase sigma-70 factor (ECF subfamily)